MLVFNVLLLASMRLIKFVELSTAHIYFMDTAQQNIIFKLAENIHQRSKITQARGEPEVYELY